MAEQIESRAAPGKEKEDRLLDEIIGLTLRLLFVETIDDLVSEMSKIAMENFPVRSMVICTRDDKSGVRRPIGVFGYTEDRAKEIKEGRDSVCRNCEELLRRATPMGKSSRYCPAEMVSKHDKMNGLLASDPEGIGAPRTDETSWHALDRVGFPMYDRTRYEIGSMCVTNTTDGMIPDENMIEGLEILASVGSVALELSQSRERGQMMLDGQENRAAQMSQILTVTSTVLMLTSPSKLIQKVLEFIDELFGFKSSSIASYDEEDKCFNWTAFRGYSEGQMAKASATRITREIIERFNRPEYRIGYLAHYRPAERTLPEDLSFFFAFDSLSEAEGQLRKPRDGAESWHELDALLFLIQNRTGKIVGVLFVDNPRNGKIPSRETIEMIEVFVSLVAIAMENADLYSEANRAKDEVHVLNRLMFHDLMNYSMAISGYLDLAASQQDDAGMERYVERARKQIDVTAELIEKVRKLSAIRSLDRSNMLRIDLVRTISTQANRTAVLFPSKKVVFAFDFETEDAFVMANDLLPDLFHNIFMNAIKADMHDPVMIEVALKERPPSEGEGATKSWVIRISDHGPGIPDERKATIFLGTQKIISHEPVRGMGLGLSIVRSLLDLYGGEVWVEDREPGHHEKGAAFIVRIPAA